MISVPLFAVAFAATATAHTSTLRLTTRAYGSTAVCRPEFTWTDNSKNVSPCALAANVVGICAGPNWNVPALTSPLNGYDAPVADGNRNNTANLCNCSWAAYNLLSVCAICQGSEAGVRNWSVYRQNCGDKLSTTYFPVEIALPSGLAIPAYAATNPSTWSDQRFNLQEARAIHDQGVPDVIQVALEQKKSSTPIGAIVGGVIGGVTIVAVAVIIVFYLNRKKQQGHPSAEPKDEYLDGPGHNRNMSDFSQKSTGIGQGYQQMDRSYVTSPGSQNQMSPTSGTLHTHNGSVNSLSYFGSINHTSVAAYSSPASPPPISRVLSPSPPSDQFVARVTHANRENIIEPFILGPSYDRSNMSPSSDRKRADGAIIPVYDSPNSLPHHVSRDPPELGGTSENTPSRRRVNPPAYSAVDASTHAGSPPRKSPLHSKKGSADTDRSFESNLSGATTVRHGSPVGGGVGSISAIAEVVQSFGHEQEDMSGTGGTLATGQSLVIPPRTGVFRPVNS